MKVTFFLLLVATQLPLRLAPPKLLKLDRMESRSLLLLVDHPRRSRVAKKRHGKDEGYHGGKGGKGGEKGGEKGFKGKGRANKENGAKGQANKGKGQGKGYKN
ncbi:hypothetical protein pipiens_016699 [Culex pipiens pipiens]|uniref:Uncharacterized protein n=1 Tax=Culex pipiens pipiens TaxID=38569 RepID=A0ABD1CKZ7_CULPP